MQTCRLLRDDAILLSQPKLIEEFGRAGAQFLSQLHYWLEHSQCGQQHQGQKWVYNTETSWANQLKLSVRQFRRHVASLTNKGIIFVQKLNPNKSNRTNYFSINYELLKRLLENLNFVHEDIMSSSSGQNDLFYIETKITNKDFNKSEAESKKLRGQRAISETEQIKQVERVKKSISKIEKNRIGEDKTFQEDHFKKQQPKTSTAQDMLEIWNEVLGEKAKASMSKELAPLLVSAYATKFEKNLNRWNRYCALIKSSSYLMAENFQLSIFWALKFSTIDRIRSGNLGVQVGATRESVDALAVSNEQVEQMIENLSEADRAKETRRKIAKAVGFPMYLSWFHQAQFLEREGEIQVIAPNRFVENKWEILFPWINKKEMAGEKI